MDEYKEYFSNKKSNLNISVKKLQLKDLLNTETFMSKVFDLDIDGSSEKVLPREITYDIISDEPIHVAIIFCKKYNQDIDIRNYIDDLYKNSFYLILYNCYISLKN